MKDRITLPTGGILIAPDSIENPPDECSRVFSLLPLVACYLASTQCLLKVLEFVRPLVDLVNALSPSSPAQAAETIKVLKAAEQLVPCELAATGLGGIPFLRELLCLVVTALSCTTGQLKALVNLLTALAEQLAAAQASGNAELAAAIKVEQQNAQIKAARVAGSVDSVRAVLDLAGPMFAVAGTPPLQLPESSQMDLPSLSAFLSSLESAAGAIQILTDSLGGC
jgi:hypothetical protein